MKRQLVVSMLLGLSLSATVAQAAPRGTYRWTDPSLEGKPWTAPAPSDVSHIIYLNNCQPSGCTLHSGFDDSTTDTSSIPNGTSVVSAYSGTADQWNQIVQCVQQTYAPFNVQIVTTRPAAGTNFHEAIVAGHAADVGEPQGVLGVSPFSCGYISNSISFSFANEEPTNIYDICWTVSQETAHSWGLDHKFDDRDPMTYLSTGPSWKQYQNQAGSCGEYSARTCKCTYDVTGSAQENAYALILATFGSNTPDTTPPTVSITSPSDGASVQPGFGITANATDDIGVAKVELRIDGTLVGQALTSTPYAWNAPSNLSMGAHSVEVTAYDLSNNTAKATVNVVYGQACTNSCPDPTQVCVSGHCVAGPGNPGGLGTTCMTNSDCSSNQCADDGQGHKYCVENCDPTMNSCPSGFGCVAEGGTAGVCWPGANNGGGSGGCNSDGGHGTLLMGIGFALFVLVRRRK